MGVKLVLLRLPCGFISKVRQNQVEQLIQAGRLSLSHLHLEQLLC